jgi:hypothetical protein
MKGAIMQAKDLVGIKELLDKTYKLFKSNFRAILISHLFLLGAGFLCAEAFSLIGEISVPVAEFLMRFINVFIPAASLAAVSRITINYVKREEPNMSRYFGEKGKALSSVFGILAAFFSLNRALSVLIKTDLGLGAYAVAAPLYVVLTLAICYFAVNYPFIFQTICYADLDFSDALKKAKDIATGARFKIIGRYFLVFFAITPLILIYYVILYAFLSKIYFFAHFYVIVQTLTELVSLICASFIGCASTVMFLYLERQTAKANP